MDILVIDRELLTNQLIAARLGAKGHKVTVEPNKNAALDLLLTQRYDCILVDPSPLSDARPVIVSLLKNLESGLRPYLLLLGKSGSTQDSILAGGNDFLMKPLDQQELETKIRNAERLIEIERWLAREDDVRSADGLIGKAAFYQLYLSALDRAFRYGERSMAVFISFENHVDLRAALDPSEFDAFLSKLVKQMNYMRRQSDVIGRLSQQDFVVLLQRPQSEVEPLNAIDRFSEFLTKFYDDFQSINPAPSFRLTLLELPQGQQHAERYVPATKEPNVQV